MALVSWLTSCFSCGLASVSVERLPRSGPSGGEPRLTWLCAVARAGWDGVVSWVSSGGGGGGGASFVSVAGVAAALDTGISDGPVAVAETTLVVANRLMP